MGIKIRLEKATDEWCAHMEARSLTNGTIRSRKSTLTTLKTDIGDIYVENISHRHIDQFFAAHPWSERTRNLKLGQLRVFFDWARSRRYMGRDDDPTFGWRMLTPVDGTPRLRLAVGEWQGLFAHCLHPTETIAVATGLYLFLRGSEQQAIQMKHIRLDDGEIDIYRRKTREWDAMPISAELDTHLRTYLTWYATQVAVQPEHYLLAPRIVGTLARDESTSRLVAGGGQIDPTRPHSKPHLIIQRILDRAGYETAGEGEHTLRRSGARAYFDVLAESGYDGALRRVQSMLGHKNSLVTEQYLGLDLDRRLRNEEVSGKPMFPNAAADNVVDLHAQREG